MTYEYYNNTLRNSVFSEHSLTDAYYYHTSAQAETRLELDTNGHLKYTSIPFPKFQTPYLKKLFRKAPYEAALMDRILNNKRKFFFLQGGTGCGKSSCFRFLESECNQITPIKWREKTKLKGFITRVDLQYCHGFLINDHPKEISSHVENFLERVADNFYESIIRLSDDSEDEILARNLGQILHNNTTTTEFEKIAIEKLKKLSKESQEDIKELYTDEDAWKELGNIVILKFEELQGSKKFERVLDLAHALSSLLPENQEIIICFDNCDRLQREFLIELIGRLMILDQPGANENSKLKALLYVRMSTIKDGASAFPRADVVSSASLAPVNALLSRITRYLWSEERKELYVKSAEEAKRLDANLLEIIVSFTEPYNPTREIIESICGSDIRRCFKIITNWLIDGQFTVSRFSDDQMNKKLPQQYRSTLLKLWLQDYISVWYEEFFDQCCLSNKAKKEAEQLAFEHTERIILTITSVLRKDRENITFLPIPNADLTDEDLVALEKHLLSMSTINEPIRIRCKTHYSEKKVIGFDNKLEMVFSKKYSPSTLLILKGIWNSAIRISVNEHTRHESNRAIFKSSNRFLKNSMGKLSKNKHSRFSISSEMLDQAFSSKDTPKPYNLIVGNGNILNNIPLWIISTIYGSCQGSYSQKPVAFISGRNIVRAMRKFNIPQERVLNALSELAEQQYRLIFSSIHDEEYFRSNAWLSQNFYLTRAGYNFASKMMSNLHYIEWCLMNNDHTRMKYFLDILPIEKNELSLSDYDPEISIESSNPKDIEQLEEGKLKTLTALQATLKAIDGIATFEKRQVEECLKSENVMPFIKCATPTLQIGYNVYTETKSIAIFLQERKRVGREEVSEINLELDNFKNRIHEYVNYIADRSRRDLLKDFKGMLS